MVDPGWQVFLMPAELPVPSTPLPFVSELPVDWDLWLAEQEVPVRTPFLLSPRFEYDVGLNAFFRSGGMVASACNTQVGYARDVAAFLTFLWRARERVPWRDACQADHVAYLTWRRRDEQGPRVSDSTWDREVAAVNRFYEWQVRAGNVRQNPVPQRARRARSEGAGSGRDGSRHESPATYTHGAARGRMEWVTAAGYRRWRDVGIRGRGADGLADPRFRGRWAARNATFCDVMVRTGLRLSEQAALSVFEVPMQSNGAAYQRFWLPPAIAKGGSARWIYVPSSLIADLSAYVEIDRAEVIEQAQADGRYRRLRSLLVVEDPERRVAQIHGCGGVVRTVKVAQLDIQDRFRLLIDGSNGLQPAAFWLSEYGLPVALPTWKDMFRNANRRCTGHGIDIHVHAHLLRHSFAVMTLEQLQRGHIAALAELTPEQRGHYTRVFGDPLDWVRRRLGHRSVVTTQIYLHALTELEMETRMALVPDDWEDPRDSPAATLADETTAPGVSDAEDIS